MLASKPSRCEDVELSSLAGFSVRRNAQKRQLVQRLFLKPRWPWPVLAALQSSASSALCLFNSTISARPRCSGRSHTSEGASLVVLHELRADVDALAGGYVDQGFAVAPGELAEDVALLRCVAAQLRQPGPIILLHSCRPVQLFISYAGVCVPCTPTSSVQVPFWHWDCPASNTSSAVVPMPSV